MERPNKNDYLTTNQFEYNQLLSKYYDALEAYIDVLEKQLLITDVVVPKGTLCECKGSGGIRINGTCARCNKPLDAYND